MTSTKIDNKLTQLFSTKKENLLNIYFTAGYPQLEDTRTVLKALQDGGADMVEIGIPFSDPLADGPIIQESNDAALHNGITLKKIIQQLQGMRNEIHIPVLMMGYINSVLQYGVEKLVHDLKELGVDGMILPDMPVDEYKEKYQELFEAANLSMVFLVTPQTSTERLNYIDEASSGFIYVVSTASTTGNEAKDLGEQKEYFERIKKAKFKNPTMIGFNIKDHASYREACQYANGAIIGSAFIKMLGNSHLLEKDIKEFVSFVKQG
ncbi:MAG TPA: tryptophan synthase subunit alpha [Cytophagaceae bacterium]|jgi:tryptophan synthase alpha chain|nr:tryptophan synthase subunit alpha [Cytophagaceae bacterium]